MKSILEESFPQKINLKTKRSKLIQVKPGTYMMLSTNKMKRIARKTQGLELGQRVKGDNHKAVLIEDEVILVPFDDK